MSKAKAEVGLEKIYCEDIGVEYCIISPEDAATVLEALKSCRLADGPYDCTNQEQYYDPDWVEQALAIMQGKGES